MKRTLVERRINQKAAQKSVWQKEPQRFWCVGLAQKALKLVQPFLEFEQCDGTVILGQFTVCGRKKRTMAQRKWQQII